MVFTILNIPALRAALRLSSLPREARVCCVVLAFLVFLPAASARAQANAADSPPAPCASAERACLLGRLEALAVTIPESKWRDRTLRELAKTLAFEGHDERALALIGRIENPDTRAMAIRGIGMAAAERKAPPAERAKLFAALTEQADKIAHKPSQAIALTYIAMAQAFAGDDDAARETAARMENPALRHKAFGETAEIQAGRGDVAQMKKSLAAIDDLSYRAKSSLTVAKILARAGLFDAAAQTVQAIDNPTLQTEGLQFILDRQSPREAAKQDLLHEAPQGEESAP